MRSGAWLLLAAVVSCGGRKPLERADGATTDAVADGATSETPVGGDAASDGADVALDGTALDDATAPDGDGSDGDRSDGSPVSPLERVYIALETAKVGFANRCAPYPVADLAGVLARSRPELLVRAVAEGRAAFDAQRAAACQAAWDAADCLSPPPDCDLLVPLVPEGGRCVVANDVDDPGCVRGTMCRNANTCTSVCEPRRKRGEYCGAGSRECLEGLHCVLLGISPQCVPIGREGDPCTGSSNSGCDLQNGFECSFDAANVCRRLPVTGPCAGNPVGFRCDPRVARCSPEDQCVPLGNVGAPCVFDDYCHPKLTCSAGVCTRGLKAVGEACTATEFCVAGTHCDLGSQTCQRPNPVGLPCDYDFDCAGNCNPDTHRCEAWRPRCER